MAGMVLGVWHGWGAYLTAETLLLAVGNSLPSAAHTSGLVFRVTFPLLQTHRWWAGRNLYWLSRLQAARGLGKLV